MQNFKIMYTRLTLAQADLEQRKSSVREEKITFAAGKIKFCNKRNFFGAQKNKFCSKKIAFIAGKNKFCSKRNCFVAEKAILQQVDNFAATGKKSN